MNILLIFLLTINLSNNLHSKEEVDCTMNPSSHNIEGDIESSVDYSCRQQRLKILMASLSEAAAQFLIPTTIL